MKADDIAVGHLRWLLLATVLVPSVLVAGPAREIVGTVVELQAGGSYAASFAKSLEITSSSVVLGFASADEASEVAAQLGAALPQIEFVATGNSLKLTGAAAGELLAMIAGVALGELDPLADLAQMGIASAGMALPEAGGSIRVSATAGKDGASAAGSGPSLPNDVPKAERLIAKVLRVERGAFPQVTLHLKVRRAPLATSGEASAPRLRRGKVVSAEVLVPVGRLNEAAVQRNLGAWYLRRGDFIAVHVAQTAAGTMTIDWLNRRPRTK